MAVAPNPRYHRLGRYGRRNPLRRRSDVVEAWTVLLLGAALWVGAPLAGVFVGYHTHHETLLEADRQRAVSQAVRATLSRNTPATGASAGGAASVSKVLGPVRWTTADGRGGTGVARVAAGSRAGATVTVWLDGEGRITAPPPSHADAWARGTGTGIATTAAVAVMVGGAWLTVRGVAHRRRMAEWEREWAMTGPQWDRGKR